VYKQYLNVHFYCWQATALRQTSTYLPCTKPSVSSTIDSDDYLSSDFKSLCQIHASALTLHDNSIGKGVFAKCYHALLVSHRNVCVNVFLGRRRSQSFVIQTYLELFVLIAVEQRWLWWAFIALKESLVLFMMQFYCWKNLI